MMHINCLKSLSTLQTNPCKSQIKSSILVFITALLLTTLIHSLIELEATTGFNTTFFQSLAFDKALGQTQGIDTALKVHDLDMLVLPAPGFMTVPAGKSPLIK